MALKPILELRGLRTRLGGKRGFLRPNVPPVWAVDGVDLTIRRGEIFGVVGESGCGKTTLGRTILGVLRESAGEIRLKGRTVSGLAPRQARQVREEIQYVYQDAGASLDPWWSIGRSLKEPLTVRGAPADAEELISDMLVSVGLDPNFKKRYPHELSGGQLRRIALARILVLSPDIVILDEPTSGLDVSVQAAVLKLLRDLRQRLSLTYIFISHDLSVVRLMCDRVAIMYLGKLVEVAEAARLFDTPAHPYTRALFAAAPSLTPGTLDAGGTIGGELPDPAAKPSGCAFRTRCRYGDDICASEEPIPSAVQPGHTVRCHHWRTVATEPT